MTSACSVIAAKFLSLQLLFWKPLWKPDQCLEMFLFAAVMRVPVTSQIITEMILNMLQGLG